MRVLARAFLFLLCLFCAAPCWAQAKPVKIGAFLSVTGDGAYVGAPQLATLQLYIELINKQGGVIGRPVELVYYDIGIDTRSAQTAVHRLIETDRVDLIIGGSTTGAAMAVLPLIEQAQIPFMALAGSSALVNPVNPWVFKTSQTDGIACAKILQDMKKNGLVRIALIAGDNGFSSSMKEQCATLAPSFGVTIFVNQTYSSQTRKLTEPLARIRAMPEVQAVLAIDFGAAPPYLAQAYRRLGAKAPLYQTHAQVTDDYLNLAGDAAEGVRMPVAPLDVVDDLADTDPTKRMLRAYIDTYRKRWDVAPNVYGSHAHDALLIAISAIARAGSTDKAQVRRMIEATDGFAGANGIYRMTAQDHMGLDLSSFRMAEVRNGTWVLIE
jgi:branched-chain amino acid transport system substrate-binding protein